MPKVTVEHRTARHDQIVAAARHCAINQGFHKTTMADVIRESGLSAGAVYGYFKSKEEIVGAIAEDALSTIDDLFDSILASEHPLTPLAALEATIEHVVKVAEAPGGAVVLAGEPDAPGAPLLADRPLLAGAPAAYVCWGYVCDRPVGSVEELVAALRRG